MRSPGGRARPLEGEGNMGTSDLAEETPHSGGVISGGMVTRTRSATGEILSAPVRNHWKLGRPYNQVFPLGSGLTAEGCRMGSYER